MLKYVQVGACSADTHMLLKWDNQTGICISAAGGKIFRMYWGKLVPDGGLSTMSDSGCYGQMHIRMIKGGCVSGGPIVDDFHMPSN